MGCGVMGSGREQWARGVRDGGKWEMGEGSGVRWGRGDGVKEVKGCSDRDRHRVRHRNKVEHEIK